MTIKRFDATEFVGREYLREQIGRSISLLKKTKRVGRHPEFFIRTGYNLFRKVEAGDTFVSKSGGLPSIYLDITSLPKTILSRIDSHDMMEYWDGRILAYVGDTDYPQKTVGGVSTYKIRQVRFSDLKYFIRVYSK